MSIESRQGAGFYVPPENTEYHERVKKLDEELKERLTWTTPPEAEADPGVYPWPEPVPGEPDYPQEPGK